MFKFKSQNPYWTEFSTYQTFSSVDELNKAVKEFISVYDLTDAIKTVLNTIKLHAKRYFGVCWLRKEKIAQKAGVSMSTVDRAIKGLKETGFLKVVPFNHTKFGRQTHNIYILNPIENAAEDAHSIVTDNDPRNVANEVAQESSEEPSKPCAATDSDDRAETHKNPHTNYNTKPENHLSIKRVDELKFIPSEFIDLLEPFYANQPKIIRDRWKTVCVAAKRSGLTMDILSWDSVGQAWKDVIRFYKRGKIKNSTDDGIGAYFYGVLCDYLLNDCLRSLAK